MRLSNINFFFFFQKIWNSFWKTFRLTCKAWEKFIQEEDLGFESHAFEKSFFLLMLKKNSDLCLKVCQSRYNKKRAFLFCAFVKELCICCKKDFVFHLDFRFFFSGMCFFSERYKILLWNSVVRISQVKSRISWYQK